MIPFNSRSMAISLAGACAAGMLVGIPQQVLAADSAATGTTQVARWQDNKKAAFLLMFDDDMPSHLKNAIPELRKRNFTGTFYVNPGKGLYTEAWQKEIPGTGMEYGNHTYTHSGAADAAKLDEEIRLCNESIAKAFPDRKMPRLISWGQPGTPQGTWLVSKEQVQEALTKYNLVDRGPFMGAAVHYKTGKDMVAVVDKAIADGSAGYIVFHGVGGEWISASMPDFIQLLDHLVSTQDQVWVTDHISSHKYATERDNATVKVLEASKAKIRVSLACTSDPKLYDLPLTLISTVPAAWKQCTVLQGKQQCVVPVLDGKVTYQALPGKTEIILRPAK